MTISNTGKTANLIGSTILGISTLLLCGCDEEIGHLLQSENSQTATLTAVRNTQGKLDLYRLSDGALDRSLSTSAQSGSERQYASTVLAGKFIRAPGVLGTPYFSTLLYLDDGRLYKTSLVSPTPPEQLAAGLGVLCKIFQVYPDFKNPDESWLMVQTGGIDQDCGSEEDARSHLLSVNDSLNESSPAVPPNHRVIGFSRNTDGSLRGFILHEHGPNGSFIKQADGRLKDLGPRYELDHAHYDQPGSLIPISATNSLDVRFMRLRAPGAASDALYHYFKPDHRFTVVHQFSDAPAELLAANRHVGDEFFLFNDAGRIYRVAYDGSPAELIYDGGPEHRIDLINGIGDTVVAREMNTGTQHTRLIQLDQQLTPNAQARELVPFARRRLLPIAVTEQFLYVETGDRVSGTSTAIAMDWSGVERIRRERAFWGPTLLLPPAGGAAPSQLSRLPGFDTEIGREMLILVNRTDQDRSRLELFDPNTSGFLGNLGFTTDAVTAIYNQGLRFGTRGVLEVNMLRTDGTTDSDVLHYQIDGEQAQLINLIASNPENSMDQIIHR